MSEVLRSLLKSRVALTRKFQNRKTKLSYQASCNELEVRVTERTRKHVTSINKYQGRMGTINVRRKD